ncbi:mitochondrial import inner membrane translocase subunit tim8 [Niveomyces insectorum RCEF 264]|uniref:Mitochondrial import inner membrane translocase subunit n=1 Tax=Niveomyces insectorum RCEF 264 TaxID=1081102 RepID=A0A167QRB1_9HYPO|nr:mitochondrial import inner membrane translocase subunit tim8 [Niveomyces insectorum RCEF 264]
MDATAPDTVDQASLDRLSDKDKAELRQFVANEQQRTRLQSQTHHLTEICWKKCIAGPVKSNTLDRTEESCLVNCVDRFMDLNMFTSKRLTSMRE